jgi:hypothetical protein
VPVGTASLRKLGQHTGENLSRQVLSGLLMVNVIVYVTIEERVVGVKNGPQSGFFQRTRPIEKV